MVVVGYNEDGVIVNSGKDKGKFIPEEDFIKSWERTKFWTLLIKKKVKSLATPGGSPRREFRVKSFKIVFYLIAFSLLTF